MNKLSVNQHEGGGSPQHLDAELDQWVDGNASFTTNLCNDVTLARNQQRTGQPQQPNENKT
jgi:hypothetical protein